MNNTLTSPMLPRPLFAGKTRDDLSDRHDSQAVNTKQRPDFEKSLFGDHYFPVGSAAVDCGGNGLKVLIREYDGDLFSLKIPVENGRSIGETGRIDERAQDILTDGFRKIRDALAQHFVPPEHVRSVATAGLRSAANGEEMLKIAREEYGLNLEIIDGNEESRLVYPVTLKGEGVTDDERVMVVEIGGGSTELVYGTGPKQCDEALSEMIELGSTRMGLHDPWNSKDVESTRARISEVIDQTMTSLPQTAEGRRVFIKSSNLEDLQEAHQDGGFGKDIQHDPISREEIQFYLSEKGLKFLKKEMGLKADPKELSAKKYAEKQTDNIKLVTKLIILDELMERLGIPEIELGFKGGLKYGVLEEFIPKLQQDVHRRLSEDLAWPGNA